ncbi:MAG: two pore domain potassium channel family protein [Cyanobacteria bacterium Co-bin13]|nr:two pore domain potassium channel family protein [Cyanobacteria bacterium Co-bin13]
MHVLLQIVGAVLVLAALADIYTTVLHPRAESSWLSIFVARSVWRLFRSAGLGLPQRRDSFLSYGGPTIIVVVISVWVLLLLGFSLMIWPGLGTAIQAEQGETPTDFATAIYYSGFFLATLGTGDLAPKTAAYRLLMVLKAILGFSVFTLTLSYVLSVYNTLTSRNTFALGLHHRTADTADSTELLARLAADNNVDTLHQDISEIAQNLMGLLESNNSYPVLLYFRYPQAYYALPRIAYLSLDIATLIKSALDSEQYRSVANSSGAAELWFGGLHLLEELCQALLPKVWVQAQEVNEPMWRDHYYQALERLKAEGIKTVENPVEGADAYVSMRHQWATNLARLTKYLAYEPDRISPAEY